MEKIGSGSSICPTKESEKYPDIVVKTDAIKAKRKFQHPADLSDFFLNIKPSVSQKKAVANNAIGKCTNNGCNSSIDGIFYQVFSLQSNLPVKLHPEHQG